ncbi:hypothetical protein HDU96_002629 [Phlyctochytrium bullatum]|nr:hypothetical protein HDU96_002629 [Phlyctochytrium bullatum]
MRLPMSIPKRMPTDWVLKHIAFPPPPSHFAPQRTLDGELRPPRISIRNQARIRKACVMAGLDPHEVVGLPVKETTEKEYKMPKGNKREIKKVERQHRIEENMKKMDAKIKAWREEKRKAKEAKKPDLPF